MKTNFGDVLRNGIYTGPERWLANWWCFVVEQEPLTLMTIAGDAEVMPELYGAGKPFEWHMPVDDSWQKVSTDE